MIFLKFMIKQEEEKEKKTRKKILYKQKRL